MKYVFNVAENNDESTLSVANMESFINLENSEVPGGVH